MFFQKTVEPDDAAGATDIIIDHMEAAVLALYKQIKLYTPTKPGQRKTPATTSIYAYQLSQHGCIFHGKKADCLVRRLWSVGRQNEVVESRWNAQMALHVRAVIRVLDKLFEQVEAELLSLSTEQQQHDREQGLFSVPKLELLDNAEKLELLFCSLRTKPSVGTDIDLRGRTIFPFSTSGVNAVDDVQASGRTNEISYVSKKVGLEEEAHGLTGTTLGNRTSMSKFLVLDPTALFVVRAQQTKRSLESSGLQRGTMLCCIPLLHIIAAGVDGEWLHVAVRHEDFRSLIKNGNMALRFDTPETSSKIRSRLMSSRLIMRMELAQTIKSVLGPGENESVASNNTSSAVVDATVEEKKVEAETSGDDSPKIRWSQLME